MVAVLPAVAVVPSVRLVLVHQVLPVEAVSSTLYSVMAGNGMRYSGSGTASFSPFSHASAYCTAS